MTLHVVGVVARRHNNIVCSDTADSIAVVTWRLSAGERLDQKQLLGAEPVDGMFGVVLDQVVERVEQLGSDSVRARTVGDDAKMFVAMWCLHRQCVVTNLAHDNDNIPGRYL